MCGYFTTGDEDINQAQLVKLHLIEGLGEEALGTSSRQRSSGHWLRVGRYHVAQCELCDLMLCVDLANWRYVQCIYTLLRDDFYTHDRQKQTSHKVEREKGNDRRPFQTAEQMQRSRDLEPAVPIAPDMPVSARLLARRVLPWKAGLL